jgi:non-ribosomal peptide synthetase component E (peptide arylation enzyme)
VSVASHGSIADGVRAHARERPEAVAFVVGDRRVTYAELDTESNRVACALQALGIGARIASGS